MVINTGFIKNTANKETGFFLATNTDFYRKFRITNPSQKLGIAIKTARDLGLKEKDIESLDFSTYDSLDNKQSAEFLQKLQRCISTFFNNVPEKRVKEW